MTTVSSKIAALNDALRCTRQGGKMLITEGIQALPELVRQAVIKAVRDFKEFNKNNDPYGEHDFGSLAVEGHKIFWKIDYYDKNMEYHSDDPSDPTQTKRVLTIMLAEEY